MDDWMYWRRDDECMNEWMDDGCIEGGMIDGWLSRIMGE